MSEATRVKQEDPDSDVTFLGVGSTGHPEMGRIPEKEAEVNGRRKRQFFEAVVVSTWKQVLYERKHKLKDKKEEVLKSIKNPKVKVKSGVALSDDTLFDRITRMNCERFEPPISQELRDVTVSREFLSSSYGGNTRMTFPQIGRDFLARHGLNDFMCLSLDYNPAAPQVPGAPGLFCQASGPAREWPDIQRIITRIAPSSWLYVGQYKLTPTESLTTREWAQQSELFRNTWSREACCKQWGKPVLGRIAARRRFRCESPTREQLEAVYRSREYKNITAEDVKTAFAQREEEFAIWEMRCIGYDVEFQQSIAEHFKTWTPPPRKIRKPRSKEKQATAQKVGTGKKRKLSEVSSDSDTPVLEDIDDGSDY